MKYFITLSILLLVVYSCSNDDNPINTTQEKPTEKHLTNRTLEIKKIRNIYAPHYDMTVHPIEKIITEEFVKFDFETGKIVEEGNNWDIGFKGSKIIVNGGAKTKPNTEPIRTQDVSITMLTGLFDDSKKVPKDTIFKKDKRNILAVPTGSGNGWYNYNNSSHIMSAIPGKIFIIKSRLGKYVKMEILNYYKDFKINGLSSYYSFNYVINTELNNDNLF